MPAIKTLWSLWKILTANWRIYLEHPVSRHDLTLSREAASIPSFGFFLLLICATVIATLGLLTNSTAVIIGAMIVAPLMNPILSLAFAIATTNWRLYRRSIVTVVLGTICAIAVSAGIGHLVPVTVVGSEVVARTSPNLIDLGIAIAAGTAGAFSLTRTSVASSIAGVAIAVALIPPLCVVGIGLGIGVEISAEIGEFIYSHEAAAKGAFLLFLANLSGIVSAACLVFLAQAYGNLKKAFQTIAIWVLLMGLLCSPLSSSLKAFLIANRIESEIRDERAALPRSLDLVQILSINVRLEGANAYITILCNAPKGEITTYDLKKLEQRLFEVLPTMGIQSMDLTVRIIPVDIWEYKNADTGSLQ